MSWYGGYHKVVKDKALVEVGHMWGLLVKAVLDPDARLHPESFQEISKCLWNT